MRYRKFVIFWFINVLLICLATACNGQELSTATPPKTPVSTGIQEFFPTPIVTTTPIDMAPNSKDELEKIIYEKYSINPKCRIDLLSSTEGYSQVPGLEFIKSEVFPESQKIWVFEIADNPSKSLRAFTACETDPCYPKLFIEYRDKGIVQEINWSGRIPGRPIKNLLWIGDGLLSFSHLTNPHDAIISTIQINAQSFVFYWLVGYPCP